jgi:hypothetical protein
VKISEFVLDDLSEPCDFFNKKKTPSKCSNTLFIGLSVSFSLDVPLFWGALSCSGKLFIKSKKNNPTLVSSSK